MLNYKLRMPEQRILMMQYNVHTYHSYYTPPCPHSDRGHQCNIRS